MAGNLSLLGQALLGFMTLAALFHVAWAALLGVIVGALHGLTATLGVALMTTLTLKMAADLGARRPDLRRARDRLSPGTARGDLARGPPEPTPIVLAFGCFA